MNLRLILVLSLLIFFQMSCTKEKRESSINFKNQASESSYWNQGKAEISIYNLSQNRYQDNYPGKLISIFVKEDFLTDKQVKNEQYTSNNSTAILKNIQIRKFTTGVYDYSLFTSTFTPIDKIKFPKTLKVTATSQEWCGTIFTQFNFKNGKYQTEQRSYFENEGDTNGTIKSAVLEDEIFNTIRINPAMLPEGNFELIPAANFIQLKHLKRTFFSANAKLKLYEGNDFYGTNLNEYQIEIPALKRKLCIVFEDKAPFKIIGWLDSFPSAFDNKLRTTKVILKEQKLLPYWNMNSLADTKVRELIGVD